MSKDTVRQFVNLVAMLAALTVNILSNALPLNGLNTGEISDRFQVYSSLQDGATVHPVQTHLLRYPVSATANLDLAAGGNIDFDETGVTYSWGSICLESVPGYGGVDSVVIPSGWCSCWWAAQMCITSADPVSSSAGSPPTSLSATIRCQR